MFSWVFLYAFDQEIHKIVEIISKSLTLLCHVNTW